MRADAVKTRADLVEFIETLRVDLRQRPALWTHRDLDDYLAALAAFARDFERACESRGQTAPSNPSWRTLAEMLVAAKFYEHDGGTPAR